MHKLYLTISENKKKKCTILAFFTWQSILVIILKNRFLLKILFMTNMTISIPSELCEKMKRHAEVKWSEVVRKSIADYINKLEIVEGGVVPSSKLEKMLKDSNIDLADITLDKATEQYEKGRKLE